MEISNVERLILANQFELLSMSENAYTSKETCKNNVTILLEGYESLYDDIFSGMEDVVSPEKGRFVLDVLSMYRDISNSYDKLLKKDSNLSLSKKDIAFKGFDGNHETAQYSFAKFFIEDYKRYGDLKDNDFMEFNSHGSSIAIYRDELEFYRDTFKSQKDKFNNSDLTEKELKAILRIS